ncbi:MAG: autotransporter-associated beta strand repeat-containing protein [Akkermansia sp.]|nr:autotransporter-associated beta strand repeat-containing protein [Akkermansia sp.]
MKLRLPHKFQTALMAALASVSITTLSSGTIAVATGAALLAGQQAQAQVTGIHPMKEVVVAGETYTTTTEDGILVAEGDKADGSAISVPGYTTAEYLVLTSTNGTATNLGRYKVNATANLQNFGTVVLAAGSYQGEGGAVNFNGGQIFVNGGVTLTNDFIIGTSGYVESGYDGAFRLSGNNTFAGSLTLVQDAKMTVDGSSTVQGVVSGEGKTLTLGRSGSLTFNNQTTLGGLAMGSASATFNGAAAAKNSIGTVTSNANSTLTLINTDATISGTQSFKGNLFIGSGSIVTVAKTDSLDYNSTNTITVAAGGTLDFGDKRWTLTSKNTVVLDGGTITGTGDGTDVTKGSLYFHQGGGMLRATSTSTVNAPVRLFTSGAVTTFDVVKDAELAINGIINGAGNLEKAGAGTLTLKKNATHTGGTSLLGGTLKIATGATLSEGVFTMANGTTFVNDGTATIGKVGSASTLGGTLLNTGTLNLAGDITVNTDVVTSFEVATTGEKTYSGGTSGFLTGDTTTYYLVHTTGGTVTNSANITGVSNLTFDEGTGNITFTRNATGSGIYYVNDELTYDAATMGAATGFAIAAGATLTTNSVADATNKVLHGSGSYAALNRIGSSSHWSAANGYGLGVGVTLGTDWAGTVVISGSANNTNMLDLSKLVNGNHSVVEIKGLEGWTKNWNGTDSANIKLTNGTNGYAWKSTGGTSGTAMSVYTGTWSGEGTIQTEGNKLAWRYEGDISAWEGTFHVNSGTPTLTFAKQATEVNATIEKGGGTLNVIADTDVQFNKAITANTFTVNAGRTATLTSTASLNANLAGAGTLNVDNATLTLDNANKYSGFTGTITASGANAKLVFNAAESFGGNLAQDNGGVIEMYGTAARVADSNARIEVIKKTDQELTLKEGSGQSIAKLTMVNGNSKWLFAQAIGENAKGLYTDIDLAATTGSQRALIINTANTTAHIGSLSGVSGTEVRGDYGNGTGRALVVHQNDDTTFAGAFVLGGGADRSVSLTKYGKGTLTLTGASTSTQALTVNEGTIELAGSGKWVGATTVNEGGTLSLANNITTLFGNVTVQEGGKLTLTRMGDNAVNNASRTLTLNSGATVDLTSLGLTGVDTTPVILAKGGTIAEGGLDGVTVSLGSSAVRQGKLGVQDSNLVLTYQNADLIWDNNAGGNVWNTTSKNWHTAGHDDVHIAFMSGDSVAFNESATVSLAGATEAGRMTLAEGTTLNVTANANALTMQGITLGNGSSLVVKSTIDSRNTAALQVGLGDVSVSGTGSIDTLSSGWNVEYTITDIDGAAGSILQLGESNQVIPATVYNLTGNRDDDFKGKLKVSHNISPSAARRIAVNIQGGAETLLQFSEVELSPYNNGNSNVGLGVNTNASVMGISSEVETAGHAVIFSGQASAQGTSDFASGSTAHTLTINTAGRDFTSGAKILAQINLLKDGEGTQRFTGDLSAMNGTVGVKAGTLALTNTGASAGTLASVTVDGGALQLGRMNVSGAVAVNGGSLAFSDAASAASVSVAEGGSLMLGSGLTTTGNMTVGNGATLGLNASAPLTIGGNLELGNNITYNIDGVRHAGEYTVASAGGTLTFGTSGNVVNLNSSIYSGTLSQQDNNLVLDVTQTGKVLHMLLLTGQSNSLGAVKGEPASDAMLTEYAPHTTKMWDGNMSGSIADPSVDTKNKAWNDTNKHWFTVQRQYTPTGKGVAGPTGTPYAELTGQGDLRNAWGGATVMGPEYGFSYMMEKQGWNIQQNLNDIAIVKVSRDGGENTFWDPANSNSICPQMLDTLIKAIKDVDAEQYPNISLDGLMFLQGETGSADQGRNVRNVLTSMITYLQDGLAEAMQEGGELEGYAGKLTVSIGDSIILGEPAGPNRASTKPSAQVYKQWAGEVPNQVGFVYTQDLGLYTDNLHYDGNSQITIGARYAYTMAQVQGLDTTRDGKVRVRSQAYGDTMLGESPVALNDDAAWWKSSGDKTAYSAESLASTVAVWDVSSAHMANGERITGNLALGGIRIEDPYSDGQNPGDHQATITINCDSTGYALSIGQHGIELQQGDLSIGADVNATATQSWNTVYSPAGGTARTNRLAVTGTVTIGEGVLLTFEEGSHIRFNSIVGTGSLTIDNGVTLAMSQADVDLKGGEYSEDENGFRTENTVLIELTGDTSAITADLTQLRFEDALAGQTIMLSDNRKSLLLDTTTSKTFHVRDSVVEYSADHPEILQAKSISLHDMGGTGATLVLKQNLPGGAEPVTIVASGTGGTVVIDSGVSLNASAVDAASSALTIAGSGEYVGHAIAAVSSFTTSDVLGQGVALAQDWAGAVVVSGGNPSCSSGPYTSLDPLADIASSLVLNGVSGYFTKDMAVNGDIEFRGTGEGGTGTALTYTAGNGNTLTLNGNLSGSGDFFYNKNGGSVETVVMNGDIAEWTGNLRLGTQKTGGLNLTLGTGVTEAHFNITQDSGNNKRALTLTVNGTQEVVFMGSIGAAGAITKNGTGTLTLNAANTFSGGITVSAGTLKTTGTGTGIKSLGTGNVTINANGTLDVANNLRIDGLLTNSDGGTLRLEDGASLELYASGTSRTYNIGKVALNGSATIMNRWNGATLNVASILGEASDTLVLKTNQSASGSTWNIGSDSVAADNFKGTLVLQVADSDADNNRTATYNFKDGGMFKSATLALQDGPFKTDKGRVMTNDIVLVDSEVKFGGINDLPMEGTTVRTVNWTVKSNSNTDARTLVLDAESGSYTTKAGIDARVNIQKTGASEQTFTGSTANFNGDIDVEAGVLNIMKAASVAVQDVTIGANGTLGVYKGTEATPSTANEGTLTIKDTKTLTAGEGAHLNANLVMDSGSTLNVSSEGGMQGLIMGSTVTLNSGSTLKVDGSDANAFLLNYFGGSTTKLYTLFEGTEGDPLQLYIGNQKIENDITFESWDKPFMDASTIYTNLQAQTYYLVYDHTSSNVGMVAIGFAPEPTTGTLSLLALAALAARRRRK